jgi:hypothetical protein
MKPRISVLTLGVADLEKSLAFYRDGLGLLPKGLSAANSSMAQLRSSNWRGRSSSRYGRRKISPRTPACP